MKVLMITTGWPTKSKPVAAIFVQRQVQYLQEKIDVDVLHLQGKSFLKYFYGIFSLLTKYNYRKYDILHAQWGQSAFPAIFFRKPLVITYRGSDLMGFYKNGELTLKGKILKYISRKIASYADALIFVSQSLSDKITVNKPRYILPSGLNFDLFKDIPKKDARKILQLPADKKIILFPNSPDRTVKRYDLFLKAIESLKRDDILTLTASNIAHETLIMRMYACDLLLFTSKHEGSPNVIKEALACNLPIVSVNVGDVKDRIGEIDGCYLVENDTPEDLAAAVQESLEHDYTGYRSGQYVKDLDEGNITDKLIEIYKSVLKK